MAEGPRLFKVGGEWLDEVFENFWRFLEELMDVLALRSVKLADKEFILGAVDKTRERLNDAETYAEGGIDDGETDDEL